MVGRRNEQSPRRFAIPLRCRRWSPARCPLIPPRARPRPGRCRGSSRRWTTTRRRQHPRRCAPAARAGSRPRRSRSVLQRTDDQHRASRRARRAHGRSVAGPARRDAARRRELLVAALGLCADAAWSERVEAAVAACLDEPHTRDAAAYVFYSRAPVVRRTGTVRSLGAAAIASSANASEHAIGALCRLLGGERDALAAAELADVGKARPGPAAGDREGPRPVHARRLTRRRARHHSTDVVCATIRRHAKRGVEDSPDERRKSHAAHRASRRDLPACFVARERQRGVARALAEFAPCRRGRRNENRRARGNAAGVGDRSFVQQSSIVV